MSGLSRLPFLDVEPWRVAVISPTGRYARNQVAGMVAAGTPLIGGVALGRGGTDMDGLPLYDRIGESAAEAEYRGDLYAGRGRARGHRRMRARTGFDHRRGRRICAGA